MTNWTEKDLDGFLARNAQHGVVSPARNVANTSAPPFHLPADIILDLPVPVSVNRLRRVDWGTQQLAAKWKTKADRHLLAAKTRKQNPVKFNRIGRFEISIVLSEKKVRSDADNSVKLLIDYLRHSNIIRDDAPKNMRRLVVEWGEAPTGCRVTIRPLAGAEKSA